MIVACHECGRQISDSAAACPGCGAPLAGKPAVFTPPSQTHAWTPDPPASQAQRKGLGWFGWLVVIVLGFVFILFVHGLTMSPQLSAAYDHQANVEKACDEIIGDSALGGERRMSRSVCDEMKRQVQREIDAARHR